MSITIRFTDDVSGVDYAIAKLSPYNDNSGQPLICGLAR